MKKIDLAAEILEDLLDNGMITLEYGSDLWEVGKQDCINAITKKLENYVIVEGREVE